MKKYAIAEAKNKQPKITTFRMNSLKPIEYD